MSYDYYAMLQEEIGLEHYGIKRRSGRYPYGSGERPFQRLSGRIQERKYDEYISNLRERAKTDDGAKAELKSRIEEAKNGSDVRELLRFQSDMSYNELSEAYNRIMLVKKISDASVKKDKDFWDTMKKVTTNVGTMSLLLGSIYKIYGTSSAIKSAIDTARKQQSK